MVEKSTPHIPSLDNFAPLMESSSNDDFSSRMANIFSEADDETVYADRTVVPTEQQSSIQLFTATVFLSIPEILQSTKFGLVLLKKNDEVHIVLYDSSKKHAIYTDIEKTIFAFDELQRTVQFESIFGKERKTFSITFIDSSELSRFSILLLLYSQATVDSPLPYYIINQGFGDRIELDCSVLYDTIKHKIDDEDMGLPLVQSNIKCKLTAEKINSSTIQSKFIGLSKGATVIIKTAANSVTQVIIRKVKFPAEKKEKETVTDAKEDKEEYPEVANEIQVSPSNSLKQRISKIGQPVFSIGQSLHEEKNVESEKDSEALTLTKGMSNLNATDVHEILHRVVGVEMDRLQTRIDARIDAFRSDVLSILKKQNELIEKLIDAKSELPPR